jgi:hypothetical protein
VAPIATTLFVGFLGGGINEGEPASDYLVQVSANQSQVIIGTFIELAWALSVVGIVVTLLPILKRRNEALANGFFALRFLEAVSNILHALFLLMLLSLSHEVVASGALDAPHFQTAGALLLAGREWAFLIGSGLVWTTSALVLNILLYRERLIPRWLSGWGFVGAALSLAAYVPKFFGIDLPEITFIPIGVQEMVFAVWLIVKGINPSIAASESASTDMGQDE